MNEEILINGKKITELSDMFFEYCELKKETERLQKENKRLQMLSCAICGEKYLSPDGAELYEKNVQLQKENEDLKTYIQKMDKPEIKTIDSEVALKNIELQQENEKIKKQYNCYACGNCNGKEDYIHLEIHHKGLRKQFDEYVKRNNTLSLKIEELEKENEQLKKPCLVMPKVKQLAVPIEKYEKLYKALEKIRGIAKNACDSSVCHYNCKQCSDGKIIEKINEVLK